MTKDILVLDQLNKSFGPAHIIRGVNLAVRDGERHAVIGPNGAGKSTLFHLISGNFTPSSGSIRFQGERDRRADASPPSTARGWPVRSRSPTSFRA